MAPKRAANKDNDPVVVTAKYRKMETDLLRSKDKALSLNAASKVLEQQIVELRASLAQANTTIATHLETITTHLDQIKKIDKKLSETIKTHKERRTKNGLYPDKFDDELVTYPERIPLDQLKEKGERVLSILVPDGKYLGNPTRVVKGNLQINLRKGAKGQKNSLGVFASLTLDPVYQGDKNNAVNRFLVLKYSRSFAPCLVTAVSTFLNPAGAAAAAAAAAAPPRAVAAAAVVNGGRRRQVRVAKAGKDVSKSAKAPKPAPAKPATTATRKGRLFFMK